MDKDSSHQPLGHWTHTKTLSLGKEKKMEERIPSRQHRHIIVTLESQGHEVWKHKKK